MIQKGALGVAFALIGISARNAADECVSLSAVRRHGMEVVVTTAAE